MSSVWPLDELTPEDQTLLASMAETFEAAPGDTIISEGGRPNALLLIEQGSARVELRGREVATIGPGSLLGEMSFASGDPASATVVVSERSRVARLPSAEIEARAASNPGFSARLYRSIARIVGERLRHQHELWFDDAALAADRGARTRAARLGAPPPAVALRLRAGLQRDALRRPDAALPGLDNVTEHRAYLPHSMNIMVFATLDLMAAPEPRDGNSVDIGLVREIAWHAQALTQIADMVVTRRREVPERDFSSRAFVLALDRGVLTREELATLPAEEVIERIDAAGVEQRLLEELRTHRSRVAEVTGRGAAIDLEHYERGMNQILAMGLAACGLL